MFLTKRSRIVERQSPIVKKFGDRKSPIKNPRGYRLDLKGLWQRITKVLATEEPPEIARIVGVQRHAVYKWREGKNPPDLPNLIKIAMLTGSSLHWLLLNEGPERVDKTGSDPNFIGLHLDDIDHKLLREYSRTTDRSLEETIKSLLRVSLIGVGLEGQFDPTDARQLLIGLMDQLEERDRKGKASEKKPVRTNQK